MPARQGIHIPGQLVTPDTLDEFPLVDVADTAGGYRSVATISERDEIPSAKLRVGMVVYVRDDDTQYVLQSINPSVWNTGLSRKADLENGKLRADQMPDSAAGLVAPINQATEAQLADASSAINTSQKALGKLALETTNNRVYFALGSDATDAWRPFDDMSGIGSDITPS